MEPRTSADQLRISAVSYLNSVPLIWGLLKDPQPRFHYNITFQVPSGTAAMLKKGEADVGIVSSIELPRQNLDFINSLGIGSFGPVHSIFLISSKPVREIRSLAADSSSRTSVALCRIILSRRFGLTPAIVSMSPDLQSMLQAADAALIIGDPALSLEPSRLPYEVYDLGDEWTKMTGLPMVYAVWAARKGTFNPPLEKALVDSYHFGIKHIEDIVRSESKKRGFSEDVTREYLKRHIKYELGPDYLKGLDLYLEYATSLNLV